MRLWRCLTLNTIIKNSCYTLDIEGMTHDGMGVGRMDGLAVFVDGAIEGESVEAKIIKINKNYAVGKLLDIKKPSPGRVTPFCSLHKRCGGCSLQHIDYSAQLRFKTRMVKDSLQRIGGLEGIPVHDTIGMEKPVHYRNKAQYPVATVNGEPVIGFYARRSHQVVANDECGIQDEISGRVASTIKRFIKRNKISIYDENTGEGLVRHIVTRTGFKSGEVMVIVVINGKSIPLAQELVKDLTGGIPSIKSIFLNINNKDTNVILGDKNINIYGKKTITDYIGKLRFEISPLSFFQVNPVQTEVLYNKALEYAALTGEETVFDLYCGIGTISLFLAQKAKKVYGIESVEAAVEDARENARINGVDNVEFTAGKAEEIFPRIYEEGARANVVVVDPPRKGCDEKLLEAIVQMAPERVVYVSCNPSTLARDLKYMDANSYRTVEVQPVDMFPWTPHVECVVGMQRKDT